EGLIDRTGVFLSIEAYQSLMALEEGVHELATLGEDLIALDGDQAAMRAAVDGWTGKLPDPDSGPVVVRQWTEINPTVAHMLGLSDIYVTIITIIIFILVALGLANTVLMSIHERRREFGMLLAMGMGRLRLLAMVLLESFFLSVSAGGLGALLGILWALRLETHGLDFTSQLPGGMEWAGITLELKYDAYLTANHVTIAVAVMLVTTMLATLWPSMRAVRLRPAAAMHG
ncbi:MAG: FtsX-like permease family protein, partial [bacterium]